MSFSVKMRIVMNLDKKTVLSRLSIEEQFKSKYLVVADGNTWTFRFPTFLGSNSVVFYNGIYNV